MVYFFRRCFQYSYVFTRLYLIFYSLELPYLSLVILSTLHTSICCICTNAYISRALYFLKYRIRSTHQQTFSLGVIHSVEQWCAPILPTASMCLSLGILLKIYHKMFLVTLHFVHGQPGTRQEVLVHLSLQHSFGCTYVYNIGNWGPILNLTIVRMHILMEDLQIT